jgi:hypothetical protein
MINTTILDAIIQRETNVNSKLTLNDNYLVQIHGQDVYVTEKGNLLSVFPEGDQWEYLENVETVDTYFDKLPSKEDINVFLHEELDVLMKEMVQLKEEIETLVTRIG